MNKITGIRYIGKKAIMEDTVLNTGAIWKPEQVHNFAASLAKALLVHTDCFEEASVTVDGETYMSGKGGSVRQEAPVITYVNLTNMDAPQLALFAKREYGRSIETEGRDVEAIRDEVHRLMVTSNMDAIAEEILGDVPYGIPYTIMVSAAEHEALITGLVVAKIVPAEVAGEIPENAAQAVIDVAGADAPTLEQLLSSLDKDGLLAFAEQEGVTGLTRRNSETSMREAINAALLAKVVK